MLRGQQRGVEWEWMSSVERLVVGVENGISKVVKCKFNDLRGVLRGGLKDESRVGVVLDSGDESEKAELVWLDRKEVGAPR